jgi:hypothetical protein
MTVTVKQLKNGAKLEAPIYVCKPYVILGNDIGNGAIVINAGGMEIFQEFGTYYDDCIADIRRYDLHMNDNTKVNKPTLNIWYLHEATANYLTEVNGVVYAAPVNVDGTPDFDAVCECDDLSTGLNSKADYLNAKRNGVAIDGNTPVIS